MEKNSNQDLGSKEVRKVLTEGHRSRGRGRSKAEKKIAYAKYRRNKKIAMNLEMQNTGYLILFPASDADINTEHTFYNMGGASAIIYVHEIGPRMGKDPTLRRDMDLGIEKFHSGIASIGDLAKFEEGLAKLDIKRAKAPIKGAEDLVIFKLNREYTREEVKAMLKIEQEKLDQLNRAIYVTVLYPDIHSLVLELEKVLPAKVKNMNREYREIIGNKIMDPLMTVACTYTAVTHGDVAELEGAKTMRMALDEILTLVSIFNELRLWEVSTCIRICEVAGKLKNLLKGKIINKYETTE